MPKWQHKNPINQTKTMCHQSEHSYLSTASLEYFNTAEAYENNLKPVFEDDMCP